MGYIVDGVKYGYDSIVNQEIKRKFVGCDVHCCATGMTEYILNKSFEDSNAYFSYDDITNFYKPVCPEYGSNYGFKEVETHYRCDCSSELFMSDTFDELCGACEFKDEDHDECEYTKADDGYKCENCGHVGFAFDVAT